LVRKYVCLFMESWDCPVMKALDMTVQMTIREGTFFFDFLKFCAICPHLGKQT